MSRTPYRPMPPLLTLWRRWGFSLLLGLGLLLLFVALEAVAFWLAAHAYAVALPGVA